jgi:hypothetical protein
MQFVHLLERFLYETAFMSGITSGVEDFRKEFKGNYQVSVGLYGFTFASALYVPEMTLRRTEVL